MSDGAWKIQELASEGLPDRAAELGQLFPEAMTDGKLDIEKLKLLLGEVVDESPERYGLTWPGKRDAIRLAQKQSTATLKPMPAESVDFDTTKNVIVEGDNLEVLKLLQKSYYGGVKFIYIDPPYNTGNDFVYKDDFTEPTQAYLSRSGQVDGSGFKTNLNSEASGRYHSDWLSMMYPRLVTARNLLSKSGLIFISIDDNEVANLRLVCDEVFGAENFIASFIWRRRTGSNDSLNNASTDHEYVICYGKSSESILNGDIKDTSNYKNPDDDTRGPWTTGDLTCNKTKSQRPNLFYPITDPNTGITYEANPNRVWAYEPGRMGELISAGQVLFPKNPNGTPMLKRFVKDLRSAVQPSSSLLDVRLNSQATKALRELFGGDHNFDFPKGVDLLERIVAMGSTPDCIVLDFFAGSGTTAHAVMKLNAEDGGNRRFILVQLPEDTDNPEYPKISDVTRERVRRAGKKINEDHGEKAANLDIGFRAFRLAESNFRNWDSDTDTFLSEELDFYVDNINSGASDDDVVHEILLKAGVPLDVDLKKIQIAGENVYVAMEGLFVTSAARKINQELIDGLLALEPWPVQVVLLDAGFGDNDSLKLNARHQFASRRPESDPDKDNALRTV